MSPEMNEILWKLPRPATQIRNAGMIAGQGRQCELALQTDEELGVSERLLLVFEGVEAYRCTYLTAITEEMFKTAYGELVRLEKSDWLTAVRKRNGEFYAPQKQKPKELQHLIICLDDGPCYEFICTHVRLPS
jgi:hypothetical protein